MKEIEGFGLNPLTISFVGVMFFGTVGALSLLHQSRLIKKSQSGQSVSTPWYMMVFSTSAILLIYGWHRDNLALILLFFLRAPFTFLILKGLLKVKGFSWGEWAMALVLGAAVVWMPFSNEKELIYLVFTATGVVMAIFPPHKIWSEQSRGMVSKWPALTSFGSAIFWTFYGLMVENELIWRTSACHIVLNFIMVLAWYIYPAKYQNAPIA